ncbi:right-handed parallel beta-helix repeat-containing protein [candidate division KSB1 bacterium]|nr:right-handed parallel beta-helix repeat-containing protein [candidate division KSB1 bacterium]
MWLFGISIDGYHSIFLSNSNGRIIENKIINNEGHGITLKTYIYFLSIYKNEISGNAGDGIHANHFTNSMNIESNIIAKNSMGLNFGKSLLSQVNVRHNIIVQNDSTGIFLEEADLFRIEYNCIWNNVPNFYAPYGGWLGWNNRTNHNGAPCDSSYNISLNPEFADTTINNYHLLVSSPCINAGNPNSFYNDSDKTINDIGIYGGSGLSFNFTDYDFRNNTLAGERKADLLVLNNLDKRIDFKNIYLNDTSNFSLDNTTSAIIEPYGYENFSITFYPQKFGYHQADLVLETDDLINKKAIFKLTGDCVIGTCVENDITKDSVWTKNGSPYYLTKSIRIGSPKGEDPITFIIEPGVQIKFWSGTFMMIDNAIIVAEGVKDDPIIFSSESLYKGQYGYGLKSLAKKNFHFQKSIFKYCNFSDFSEGLDFKGHPLFMSDCVIKNMIRKSIATLEYALRSDTSSLMLERCQFINNSKSALVSYTNSLLIKDCIFENNSSGIDVKGDSAKILNSFIRNNANIGSSNSDGYGIKSSALNSKNLFINNCQIINNKKNGIDLHPYTDTFINNSVISYNGYYGIYWGNNVHLNNNLICKNSAPGISGADSVFIINNTMFGNSTDPLYQWGGVVLRYSYCKIINSIIRNNAGNRGQVEVKYGKILYCNVEGGWEGEGNIDIEPMFIDPENGNFNLLSNSPCIDAGSDSMIYNDPEDPANPGFALYPALGTIRNDMGAYGGPGAVHWPVNHAPQQFSLLLPTNGDTITTLTPTFEWEAAADPDFGDQVKYAVFYTTNAVFDSIPHVKDLLNTTCAIEDTLEPAMTYYWKVVAYDNDSLFTTCNNVFYFTTPTPADIKKSAGNLPKEYKLSQNYPNPFNPTTTIKYELPRDCHVILKIYNMLGQEVSILFDKNQKAGYHDIQWDATSFASGLYFYSLKAISKNNRTFNKIKKMLILK